MCYSMYYVSPSTPSAIGYYQMGLIGIMVIVNTMFVFSTIDYKGIYRYVVNIFEDK